jgi:transposase-like protein
VKLRASYDRTIPIPKPLLTVPPPTKTHVKQCPECGSNSRCVDSRSIEVYVRRRYQCRNCPRRWTALEVSIDERLPLNAIHREALEGVVGQLALQIEVLRKILK